MGKFLRVIQVAAIILTSIAFFGCQSGVTGTNVPVEKSDDEAWPPYGRGFYGQVRDCITGNPINGVQVEVWCADCDTRIIYCTTRMINGVNGRYDCCDEVAYKGHYDHTMTVIAFKYGYETWIEEGVAPPDGPTEHDIEMVPE